MPARIEVIGQLVATVNGGELSFMGCESMIVVEASNRAALKNLFRMMPVRPQRGAILIKLHRALVEMGLTVSFNWSGGMVAKLGENARNGIMSRLFGFGPLQIHPFNLIRSAFWRGRPENSVRGN